MTTTAPLLAGGATLSFSCLESTVIKTDQRSDSYTTGSGRVLVLEGTGGGNSHVPTEVVISRDIWFNDREGQERHVRVNKDIPVREGQDIAFLYASGEKKLGEVSRQQAEWTDVPLRDVNQQELHGLVPGQHGDRVGQPRSA